MSSKAFIIGLDLDGVCYHFERTARYMLRKRIEGYGGAVPPELFKPSQNWDWIKDHVPSRDWEWLWNHGAAAGLFRYGHVVGGSIEGVQALNKIGDVVAITARPKQAVHDTLVWLATMFDKAPLSGLVIQSHGQLKSEVRPLPDVYIDDAAHNADDILTRTSSDVILYDQPWNKSFTVPPQLRPRFTRVKGWPAVVDRVKEIKG